MFGGTGSNLFGQKPATTAPTGFGLTPQQTAPSGGMFGTPTAQQQQPTLGLGTSTFASPQHTAGFSFPSATPSTTTQGGGGFQIASPAASIAPNTSLFSSTLGSSPATPKPTFGITATTTAQQPTLNFGLGSNAPKTTAQTGFSLGAPTTTSAGAPTVAGGLNFGFSTPATTSAAPTLNFGLGSNAATPLTATLSLGATTTAGAAPTLNFGLGSNASTAVTTVTSTPAPTFGLGTTATTAAPLSFGLGTTATTTTSAMPSLSFNISTTTAPSTVSTFGVGQPTTTAGLGGTTTFNIGQSASIATSADQLKVNPLTSLTATTTVRCQTPNYKDQLIPVEMAPMIESFKTFVKDQKRASLEVNRASLKQITKVTEYADSLKRMTMQLERTVNKNKALNRKLRTDVARGIQDCEVVQRLALLPRGFPSDNTLAFEYFKNINERFQSQAETLTVELKNMEKHIVCKLNPTPFTPEELSLSLKRLYESFIALAGRYQSIHSSVTSLKMDVRRKKDPWYGMTDTHSSATIPFY